MKTNKLKLFFSQKGKCHYCLTDLMKLPFEMVTIDHILAKAKGGGEAQENKVIACLTCNQFKKDKDYDQFMKWISKYQEAVRSFNETFNT